MIVGIIVIAVATILLAIAIGRIKVTWYNPRKLRKELEEQDNERIERILRAKKTVRIVEAEDTMFKRMMKNGIKLKEKE